MSTSPYLKTYGFTLIEMVVVVLIVSILASAVMPLATIQKRRQQETDLRDNLRQIRRALDEYKRAWDSGKIEHRVEDSGYPPNLETLVQGVKDVSTPKGGKLYFLRRIPRDPFSDPDLPDAKSWGLRSYASPPEAPAPGKDVFDVYSLSSATGLDGTPYGKW